VSEFNILFDTIIGYFGDESFQAITYTSYTDINQHKTEYTKLTLAKLTASKKRCTE